MALFLSESIRTSVKSISLNEALTDLVVLMDEGQSLTEALYQADFIKFLNEEVTEKEGLSSDDFKAKYGKIKTGKDMNFLQRAWEAIKTFAKKVWMKVVQVFNAVKNKITAWFHRIMGNKSEIFNANKSKYQYIRILLDGLDEQLILAQRRWNDADDAKEAFDRLEEKLKDKLENIDVNDDDYVKISKSELKQLASRGTKALNDLQKVEKMANSHITEAENAVKNLVGPQLPESKEKAEKMLKQVKFEARIANTLAGKSAKIGSMLADMVRVGQKSADDEEDDEKANKK